MHGTVQPLGNLVQDAAAEAGLEVTLKFDAPMAGDIAGRALAFGSLVKGGMGVEDAARLSGLLADED